RQWASWASRQQAEGCGDDPGGALEALLNKIWRPPQPRPAQEVARSQLQTQFSHLGETHADCRVEGDDEGTDAGADHFGNAKLAFQQRFQHADMSHAAHTAGAQDDAEGVVLREAKQTLRLRRWKSRLHRQPSGRKDPPLAFCNRTVTEGTKSRKCRQLIFMFT